MATTDNNAQTWRDLTDQLTPKQIALFAEAETRDPEELLETARGYAAQNLLQLSLADVAIPAGATNATSWYQDDDNPHRTVYAGRWTVGNTIVVIVGDQDGTGATQWQIEVQEAEGTYGDLTAEQARELSAVLVTAADRLDQLDGTTPPFM